MLSFFLGIFDVQHLDFSSLGPPQSFCGKPKYYWCSDVFFLAFPLTEYLFQTSQPQSHNGYRTDRLVTFIQYPSGVPSWSILLQPLSLSPSPLSIFQGQETEFHVSFSRCNSLSYFFYDDNKNNNNRSQERKSEVTSSFNFLLNFCSNDQGLQVFLVFVWILFSNHHCNFIKPFSTGSL